MKKQTAIIIIAVFCVLITTMTVYVYKMNAHLSPEEYSEAISLFNDNDPYSVINQLQDRARNDEEKILLAASYLQVGSLSLSEQDGFVKAKPILEELIADDSQHSEALRLMAYGYEITEDYDSAFTWYDKAIIANTGNAEAYSGKAHALALTGRVDEAIKNYESALAIDASLDHAQLGLARIYIKTGVRNTDALAYLQSVVDNSANKRFVAEASQMIGVQYMIQEKFVEAKNAFTRSIEIDPTLAQSYVGRTQASFVLFKNNSENNEEAFGVMIRDLEKATQLNPFLANAYYTAGTLIEYTGKYEIAQSLYKQAATAVPQDISLSQDEKDSMLVIINTRIK